MSQWRLSTMPMAMHMDQLATWTSDMQMRCCSCSCIMCMRISCNAVYVDHIRLIIIINLILYVPPWKKRHGYIACCLGSKNGARYRSWPSGQEKDKNTCTIKKDPANVDDIRCSAVEYSRVSRVNALLIQRREKEFCDPQHTKIVRILKNHSGPL